MKYMQPLVLFRHLKLKTSKPGRLLGINMCTNNIGVSLTVQCDTLPSYLGKLPINSSVDVVTKKFKEWSVHVVHFVQELSKTKELQGLKYTYWGMSGVNITVRLVCKDLESDEFKETVCEEVSPVALLEDYRSTMCLNGSYYCSTRSCSEVLKEFTEQCTTWGNSIIKLGKPIKMTYSPLQNYWGKGFGWIATVARHTTGDERVAVTRNTAADEIVAVREKHQTVEDGGLISSLKTTSIEDTEGAKGNGGGEGIFYGEERAGQKEW